MKLISYRRTVVGWYNFTIGGVLVYNVEPNVFREITGVSKEAVLGCAELTAEQLEELKSRAKYIGLADGWEWVSA